MNHHHRRHRPKAASTYVSTVRREIHRTYILCVIPTFPANLPGLRGEGGRERKREGREREKIARGGNTNNIIGGDRN